MLACDSKKNDSADDDCHKRTSSYLHALLLETLDIIVSSVVIAPCVIAYWRGTWELMGTLIYPKSSPLSALVSLAIGCGGHIFFTMTQSCFKTYIHPDKCRLIYYVISRIYTAIFGVICVNMWRGSWILCDYLTSASSLLIVVVVTLLAILFLIITRTVRNLCAAPFALAIDHRIDYFDINTMFKIPGFHRPGLYILDTFFSVFVISTLVVIAWRGVWGILDLTLYTNNRPLSALGSLVIGYGGVAITFATQPIFRCICARINGLYKLIVCDIFFFLSFFSAVNTWRGIWMLLDVYFFPNNKLLSYWLSNLIPFLILTALKCANSILVRGIYIDAEEPGGECVEFPIEYIRLHFQRERTKKHLRQLANIGEEEAQRTLIDKKTNQLPQIRSKMDSSQIV